MYDENVNQIWRDGDNEAEKVWKNITMHLGRGVRTVKLKDLPEPKPRPSTEGMTRITSRGTSMPQSKTSLICKINLILSN